jgi:hypothetical protein
MWLHGFGQSFQLNPSTGREERAWIKNPKMFKYVVVLKRMEEFIQLHESNRGNLTPLPSMTQLDHPSKTITGHS